jgi:hypothetical protein
MSDEARDYDATNLAAALRLLLDHVDYTTGACRLNEMVGAALPREVIQLCRDRLAFHVKLRAG